MTTGLIIKSKLPTSESASTPVKDVNVSGIAAIDPTEAGMLVRPESLN